MKTEQRHWTENKGWISETGETDLKDAQLVLVFGSPLHIQNKSLFDEIKQSYPQAYILGGSSAGEICGTHVHENSLSVTAVFFDHTTLASAHKSIKSENSFSVGEKFADRIFIPLERLHGMSTYEGTGIGLAICKKIISRHGGSIFVKSQEGHGSTFTLPETQSPVH